VLYNFSRFASFGERFPFDNIERDLEHAEQFDDVPAKVHCLRVSLYVKQNQHQKAIASYERFFERIEYRACLQSDVEYFDDAREFLTN
jgi:hypothetical protein